MYLEFGEERVELCHHFISFIDILIDFFDNFDNILRWYVLRRGLFKIFRTGPWKVVLLQIQIDNVSGPDAVPDPWWEFTPEWLLRFHQWIELALVVRGQVLSKGSRTNQQIPDVKIWVKII